MSSLIDTFSKLLEENVIDKNYHTSTYNDEILTYHWYHKHLIIDILIKENNCGINKNNISTWYSFDDDNILGIIDKILTHINE
jgi:hypothetical protein